MHSSHPSSSSGHRKSGITTVEQVENVLEQFMEYHACFLWDRTKEFMETERDLFRSTHHNHATSILFSMMNALIQLAHADKNYLTLQFFSSKVFQRKDSLKSSYEHLKAEFQRLEERGFLLSKALSVKSITSLPPTPSHQQSHSQLDHCSIVDNFESETAQDAFDIDPIYQQQPQSPSNTSQLVETPIESMKCPSPTTLIETDLNVPRSQNKGLFSKASQFFRFSSRSSSNAQSSASSLKTNYDSACLIATSMENSWLESPVGSSSQDFSNFCMDSLDRFAAHLCGQLTHYVKARIEMIDIYEKLSTSCTSKKFCLIDEQLQTLSETHRGADRSFHHPVLNLLKTMFMLECDVLLNLLRVHSSIQDWNFLDSLFGLQDAHNKLNAIANTRDNLLIIINSNSSNSAFSSFMKSPNPALSVASSGGSGVNFLRRNFTSSSLSSSGSSNLSIPVVPTNANLNSGPLSSSNPSPNFQLASTTSFVYPAITSSNSSSSATTRVFQRSSVTTSNFNSSTMPVLIQWLNRFKLFLLSKYSFYFHSLLKIHLTPSSIMSSGSSTSSSNSSSANYAHTESQIRQLCSKHLYDFHSKMVQFIRKFDSSYAIIIFDSHSRNHYSFTGYRSPYIKKELPKGISSFPIIYSYPGEFPKNRIPALIMIMNDKMKELNSTDMVVVEYDKPLSMASSNQSEIGGLSASQESTTITTASVASVSTLMNRSLINGSSTPSQTSSINLSHQLPNATYFLVRPDPDFTLAIVIESKRLERDSTQIVAFMQEMGILLKGTKIMTSLRTGNMK